ncbi:hypothetical protein [Mucilaginibacter sp.]|uniref:hypothetical protein n=1 Tax=Mucilaginibacter sp. TaxID=1882438 RepID=UPI0035BC3E76
MKLLDLVDYFSDFAVENDQLQHVANDDFKVTRDTAFIASDTQENSLDDLVKISQKEFILILLPYDKKMLPVQAGAQYWGKNICFLVLKKLPKMPGERAKVVAKSECEEIGDALVKKMISDRHVDIFTSLNLESFTMEPVGPIGDGRYGNIYLFTLEDWFNQV